MLNRRWEFRVLDFHLCMSPTSNAEQGAAVDIQVKKRIWMENFWNAHSNLLDVNWLLVAIIMEVSS